MLIIATLKGSRGSADVFAQHAGITIADESAAGV